MEGSGEAGAEVEASGDAEAVVEGSEEAGFAVDGSVDGGPVKSCVVESSFVVASVGSIVDSIVVGSGTVKPGVTAAIVDFPSFCKSSLASLIDI